MPGWQQTNRPVRMHQLLLLRHANSTRDDPELADHARPLSERGRRAAAALRGTMRDLGLQPDVVLVSSARRTLETLAALEPWDETPLIEQLDRLYMASAQQMLRLLRTTTETARSVLLVGHNPGVHDLALLLAGGADAARADPECGRLAESFPAAALAELALSRPWRALGSGGARLLRFINPPEPPRARS